MKRSSDISDRRYLAILIFASLLPFLIIFIHPLLPHTSDGGVHLPRMGAYYKALADGHFPVRWAGDLNYGYGLPLFNFMYHTPYLVSSFFIWLGIGLVPAFKATLALSYLLSGIFMYMFIREWLGDSKKALFISIFYQFAPFRLVEILVRGAIGGIYAYTFLPLLLWGIVKIAKKPSATNITITAFVTGLLIISHNSLSLIFFGISILFILFFAKSKKTIFWSFCGLFWGLLLSAFYWLPALFEHKYTYGDLFMENLYKMYFPPTLNFFLPNIANHENLRVGEISVQFGIFHVAAILLGIIGLFQKRFNQETKRILIFSLIITAISLFFMHPLSIPIWNRISFLRQFQFPWRFLALTTFSTALLALAYEKIFDFGTSKVYAIVLIFVVASTAYYWYPPQKFDHYNEADFWNYPLNTTYFGETDVIWSEGPAKKFPANRVEFIEGNGTVSNFQKKTHVHSFGVTSQNGGKLVDHTQYFPGWRVYVDGKKTPIEFQDQNWRGLITFPIPPGDHNVFVKLEESPARWIADVLSVFAGLLVIFMCVRIHYQKKYI